MASRAAISSGGGLEVVLEGGVGGGGREGLEQGGEFQLGEELAAGGVVDGLGAHRVEGELDGDGGVDGDEFLREQNIVAIILQRFAIGLALDGVGSGDSGVQRGLHASRIAG